MASAHHATVFMVLHAVIAAVTSAVTGHSDTVVGTVDAGRRHPDLEPLVGMFVGTLALRTHVDLADSFASLLAGVRAGDVDAFAHSETPFDEVVDALGGRVPLQVMFSYEGFSDPHVELTGLDVRARELATRHARFDLEIVAREKSGGAIEFDFRFDRDLLLESTVSAWADLVCDALSAAVADPTASIADILGGGTVDRGPQPTSAAVLPEIIHGPIRVEDSEGLGVDIRPAADALAAHLCRLGIGPEQFVVVAVSRSVESLIAVTAIARTGAAFVPLDPSQPTRRIATIIADVGARYVIASEGVDLPPGVVRVDPRVEEKVPFTPAEPPHLDHPAYVIYTSGTTGEPKGVVVTHRGLAPLATALRRAFGVGPDSRIVHGSSPAFDASILEYLLAWGTGATLVVLPPDRYGADDLAEFLRSQRITHWFSTPALPAQFDPDGLADLEVVGLGGEAWPADLAARWSPGRTLLNLYGPTEASVVATISATLTGDGSVPIGSPVDGMSAAVLDAALRPVPIGAVGELYLGGPGLARGYAGRPGPTAARFVASVLGPGRMYRTGDRVRRRADGQYDFIGRTDHQVQIRGIRVELGEIESVLATHPAVETAVVVLQNDVLVAYVYGPDPSEATALQAYLAERLPRPMIPNVVDVLDHVPLTVAGKIDRSALPTWDGPTAPKDTGYRSRGEQIVAGLVADVLSLGSVGRDSDFFALGGSSLLATKLVARIQEVTTTRVDVRDVFDHPTVELLARVVDGRARDDRPPLVTGGSDEPVPLAPAQRRLWLLDRSDRSAGDNVAFAVDLHGELDADACLDALRDVAERHEVLRTVLVEDAGGPVQVVRPLPPAVRVVDHVTDDDALDAELSAMAAEGFDIAVEPPVRVALFRTSPDRHTLVVVAHHIALDGLSTVPLARDFTEAYRARRSGEPPRWAPLRVRFSDYSRWHSTVLGDPADPDSRAHRDLSYWRSVLDPVPAP
ncbi:MAG: amino acid adenylation domain-containing protein, partial [Nocardiaceae bacterium]|nr:amino acid adenylation domain-containing protein [Nocardiaceae bacterium]